MKRAVLYLGGKLMRRIGVVWFELGILKVGVCGEEQEHADTV